MEVPVAVDLCDRIRSIGKDPRTTFTARLGSLGTYAALFLALTCLHTVAGGAPPKPSHPPCVALSSASRSRRGASNRVRDAEPHVIVPSLGPSVPCSAPAVSSPEPAMAPPPWPSAPPRAIRYPASRSTIDRWTAAAPLVRKAGPWTPHTPPHRVAVNAAKTLLTMAILRKSPYGFSLN